MNTRKKNFDFENIFTLEMANNHQGSVAHGKKIIQEMGKTAKKHNIRAAIKFQFRHIDTFIHPDYLKDTDNKHVSRFLSTKLTKEQFEELLKEARANGLLTMSTPFDEASVEMLEKMDIDILKIASCSAQDWPLLERAAVAGKPTIVSTGGLMVPDIDKLVSFFDHRYVDFAIQHCVAVYPTPNELQQLNQVEVLCDRYPDLTIGFSTHEDGDNYEPIQVAYAKGARIFERHVGVETSKIKLNAYSSTPKQIDKWVEAWKRAVEMCGSKERPNPTEKELSDLQSLKRGVFLKKNVKKGAVLTMDDVFFAIPIQPGQLSSGDFKEGLVVKKDYKAKQALSEQIKYTPTDQDVVYHTIHQVKGMLNEARIPVGDDFNLEFSHHYGLQKFLKVGVVIIDCINREYCKKILVQLPGQEHPYHHHKKKEEAFQVLSGKLHAELNGKKRVLYPGDVLVVQRGVKHRFWTDSGVIFEEVSSTHYNDDSFYEDPAINKMPREQRKTVMSNWGRFHFDDPETIN